MLTATVGKAHPATADTLLEVGRVDEAGGRLARAREAYATALAYLAPFPVGLDHAVLQSRIAAVDAALDEKDASLTRFARAAEAFDEAIVLQFTSADRARRCRSGSAPFLCVR